MLCLFALVPSEQWWHKSSPFWTSSLWGKTLMDGEGWLGSVGRVFCVVLTWIHRWNLGLSIGVLDLWHANDVGFSAWSKAPISTFEDVSVNSSDEAIWVCQIKSDFAPPFERGTSVGLWFNGLMAVSEMLQFSELLQVHWWVRPCRPILSH